MFDKHTNVPAGPQSPAETNFARISAGGRNAACSEADLLWRGG